jgi:hypothetical protein
MTPKTSKSKTAVEWLVEQVNADCLNSTFIRPELVEQAKAMEKEQMIDAYLQGSFHWETRGATQFYNETYGGDK